MNRKKTTADRKLIKIFCCFSYRDHPRGPGEASCPQEAKGTPNSSKRTCSPSVSPPPHPPPCPPPRTTVRTLSARLGNKSIKILSTGAYTVSFSLLSSDIWWPSDLPKISVADQDPGFGAFMTPGSRTHIFESLVTIFWAKILWFLWIGSNFLCTCSKRKQFFTFVIFVATKKGRGQQIFSPSSFVAVVGTGIRDSGSWMDKDQDPGSGINIRDPQQCPNY